MIELLIFIIGLLIGSFLNVVIVRLPNDQSIIAPPSHCPECGTRLQAWDLVPVFSWLLNRGQCRYCQGAISWQYPVVEVMTALIFFALYLKYGLSAQLLLYFILVALLLVGSVIDLRELIIPNRITYPGIIIGLVGALFFPPLTLVESLFGLIIPAGFLLLLALLVKKGMGLGDVKFLGMVGTFIGLKATFLALFLGSFLGSIIVLALMAGGRLERKSLIPFGPLISLGTILVLLWGEWIINLLNLGFLF